MSMKYELHDRYLLAVYMLLREHEETLDDLQLQVFMRLQRQVLQDMTLEEAGKIEELYASYM